MADIGQLLRVAEIASRGLQMAPSAVKIAVAVDRARQGDRVAIEWLKTQGWREGARLLIQDGDQAVDQIAAHGRAAIDTARRAIRGDLNVIDAEWREVTDEPVPWLGFTKRMAAQKFGGHIIVGSPGTGKTTLARRIGEVYFKQHGYRVECANWYPADVPSFGYIISMDTLVDRMAQLSKYLKSLEDPGEDDESAKTPKETASLPPGKRVILIDEAILAMSASPMDKARRAALQYLAQCRHLDTIVVYVGQWLGQLPLALLGQTTVWLKRPMGNEAHSDRDNPIVRSLWERAAEGFASYRQLPHADDFPDWRSWAYCEAQTLNGHPGYVGMLPFNRIAEDEVA